MRAQALALMLLLAAPLALGHGEESHGFQQMKRIGDHYVTLFSETELLMAETPTEMRLTAQRIDTRENVILEDAQATLHPPDGEVVPVQLETDAEGAFANVTFPGTGTWQLAVALPDTAPANYSFTVYAKSPWVWESLGASSPTTDMYAAGFPAKLQFRVTDIDTGEPAPATEGATARIEQWTDDHATKLGERVEPLTSQAGGIYVLETTFPEPGMQHIFLAIPELGLDYDDRPYAHVYALSREDAEDLGVPVPESSTPGVAPLLAAAAAAATACITRRRDGA